MEEELLQALVDDEVASFLIEGASLLPYLRASDIIEIGQKFHDYNLDFIGNRTSMMKSVIENSVSNHNTIALLSYFLTADYLREQIRSMRKVDELFSKAKSIEYYRNDISQQIIEKINEILIFKNVALKYNGQILKIYSLLKEFDYQYEITDNENEDITEIIKQAKKSLENSDYRSVVTKSRTILEIAFKDILRNRNVDIDPKWNLNKLQSTVSREIGMQINSDWPDRIKEFVSRIYQVTGALSEIRNKDSDAHFGEERINLKEAEAELLLHTSINLARYYQRVDERNRE